MKRRQTLPRKWLVADGRLGEQLWPTVRALPRGGGVLFLYRDLRKGQRARLLARLRRIAKGRGLIIADEAAGEARRVHDCKEMRQSGLRRVPILLLSPILATRSHPTWKPIPLMRAAALVRMTRSPVIALGGMDERRFRWIRRLGFSGWAGIDAWARR